MCTEYNGMVMLDNIFKDYQLKTINLKKKSANIKMELFILHASSFLVSIVNPAYSCSGFQCPQWLQC